MVGRHAWLAIIELLQAGWHGWQGPWPCAGPASVEWPAQFEGGPADVLALH
jgi:hypothetical protein